MKRTLPTWGLSLFLLAMYSCAHSQSPQNPRTSVAPPGDIMPPTLISHVEPKYTEDARKERCQEIAVLEAIVRKDGALEVLRVIRSTGCVSLDESAIQALKQWRFRPGSKDGLPVDASLNIAVSVNF